MCKIEDGFKLCSCEDDKIDFDRNGVFWVLKRFNNDIPTSKRVGKSLIPRYDNSEEAMRSMMLAELNSRNCFDFPFRPEENDFLSIHVKEKNYTKRYCFQYTKSQWIRNSCDGLQEWKSALENYKEGNVE